VHVTVAMLTYRRPGELRRALDAVASHVRDVAADPGLDVTADLLVVDNDPAGSARDVVAAAGAARYLHEPTPGIASARNAALAGAAGAHLLVFIDDDEVPEPGWLANLLRVWRRTGAAAVVGRVVSTFEVEPDAWVAGGGFFVRRTLPTGSPVTTAATNNLLLDLRVVRALDLWFDPSLGRSGGEDTLFSRTLARSGARLVWCDEAVVVDVVPADRVTRAFVRGRAWAHGCTSVRIDLRIAAGPAERAAVRARAAAAGAARLAGGAVGWAGGAVRRRVDQRARATRTALRGLGMLTGAAGLVVEEYADGGPRLVRERRTAPPRVRPSAPAGPTE
jgi:succinoglycan biosynthesis protein ExoM